MLFILRKEASESYANLSPPTSTCQVIPTFTYQSVAASHTIHLRFKTGRSILAPCQRQVYMNASSSALTTHSLQSLNSFSNINYLLHFSLHISLDICCVFAPYSSTFFDVVLSITLGGAFQLWDWVFFLFLLYSLALCSFFDAASVGKGYPTKYSPICSSKQHKLTVERHYLSFN